jgi:hypothetical protein
MKRSMSYLETFRQHRVLLSLPIALAVLVAAWFVLGTPSSYQSSASLWINYAAPADSSVGESNPAVTPPSSVEQQVISELLTTKSFALAVARRSRLGSYLVANPSPGFSPTALFGGGGSLNNRILAALGPKKVATTTPGPQVLQISYEGPTAAVAVSTLNAILSELQAETNRFSQQDIANARSYYQAQVATATQALATARQQLSLYQIAHPSAPATDPNLVALTAGVTNASAALTAASEPLNDAAGAAGTSANGVNVQVLDQASTPLGPTSGKKKDLEGILGGLLGGCLISFLGTIALTRRKSDPWEDELTEVAPRLTEVAPRQPRIGERLAPAEPIAARFETTAAVAVHGRSTRSRKALGGPLAFLDEALGAAHAAASSDAGVPDDAAVAAGGPADAAASSADGVAAGAAVFADPGVPADAVVSSADAGVPADGAALVAAKATAARANGKPASSRKGARRLLPFAEAGVVSGDAADALATAKTAPANGKPASSRKGARRLLPFAEAEVVSGDAADALAKATVAPADGKPASSGKAHYAPIFASAPSAVADGAAAPTNGKSPRSGKERRRRVPKVDISDEGTPRGADSP